MAVEHAPTEESFGIWISAMDGVTLAIDRRGFRMAPNCTQSASRRVFRLGIESSRIRRMRSPSA